jgi:hypothetical protein
MSRVAAIYEGALNAKQLFEEGPLFRVTEEIGVDQRRCAGDRLKKGKGSRPAREVNHILLKQ